MFLPGLTTEAAHETGLPQGSLTFVFFSEAKRKYGFGFSVGCELVVKWLRTSGFLWFLDVFGCFWLAFFGFCFVHIKIELSARGLVT